MKKLKEETTNWVAGYLLSGGYFNGIVALFGCIRMAGAGKGLAGLWVKIRTAGFFEAFAWNEEHFYGNTANGQGKKYYGEKKYLHFLYIVELIFYI